MNNVRLTITCVYGLEAVVGRELSDLGYRDQQKIDGRVSIEAPVDAIARCNMFLRTANRVLLELGRFPANDFDEFFDNIRDLPWEQYIPRDAQFPVTGASQKSKLHGVPTLQGMAKKAIVSRLQDTYGRDLPETGFEVPIHFEIRNNECTIWLNTSGAGLHRRGYRQLAGEAPLRETLAAALIQLSVWKRDRTLLDPMCGSGTIPIEAALIGRKIAPGLNRNFAGEKWGHIPNEIWSNVREEANDLIDRSEMSPILGHDRDFRILKTARDNARMAGVAEDIHFQEQELKDLTTSRKYGVLITNPPYGQRLDDIEEARMVWQTLSDVTDSWSTWSFFIFVGARDFERYYGQRATRRRKLFNGPLECTYYQYLGDKPPSMRKPQREETES